MELRINFGKYKGKEIQNTPYGYQYWLFTNCENFLKERCPEVWAYLEDNKEELEESYRESLPAWFDIIDFD